MKRKKMSICLLNIFTRRPHSQFPGPDQVWTIKERTHISYVYLLCEKIESVFREFSVDKIFCKKYSCVYVSKIYILL